MKKVVLYISFVALVISGCTKEFSNPKDNTLGKSQVTIYASIDETKTTVDGTGIFSWQDSEKISLVETDYDNNGGIDFTLADAESGAFSGTLTAGKSPVFAVSPKGILGDAYETSGDVLYDLTLPASYSDYVPGTTNAIMIGEPNGKSGDNYKFTFYQATALLKITYVNVPVGTKKFVLGSTETALTGTWTLDSTSGVYLDEASADTKGYEVTLVLKDEVKIANQTLDFFVPVPVANYKDFLVELRKSDNSVISGTNKTKDGLNIYLRAGDILPLPAISLSPVTAADAYSYTFTSQQYTAAGSKTLGTVSWTMAGTGGSYFGYDGTRGQQFGSGSNPYSALSLTSATFSPKGVKRVKVNTSGADGTNATVKVKVGDVYFLCDMSTSKSITKTATDYVFECPDGGMVPGAVAIEYSQTSSKAIYVKSIAVNGKAEAELSYTTTEFKCANDGVFAAPVLNNPHSLTGITYESNDTDIATVNPTTGAVTIVGTKDGTVTITASFAGDSEYNSDSASYEIEVADAYVTLDAATDPVKAAYTEDSTVSFDVDSNVEWTAAVGTDANSIVKNVSTSGETVTVTFNANNDATDKSATISITPVETKYRASLTKSMTVTQNKKGGSYTITFSKNSGDGTSASTSTACSTIVSAGSSYLSGNLATATSVYYNGKDGLKLGVSGGGGTIKMNLASAVTPTSVVVSAKLYNSGKSATLKVNGSATQSVSASFSNLTFYPAAEISFLQLESSKYIWIESITVNY